MPSACTGGDKGPRPLVSAVSERRVGPLLSLLRQGLSLELGFGTHSLEALLWIAETVEEAVYHSGSLVRTPTGVAFRLRNPPLRVGAFHALRARLDGGDVPSDRLRFRHGEGEAWRTAASLSGDAPLVLLPGRPVEFAVDVAPAPASREPRIRLEFESVAIPPLVWLEFSDVLRTERPA